MKKAIRLLSFLKGYMKKNFILLMLAIAGLIIISLLAIPLPYLTGYIFDNILIKRGDIIIFYQIIALLASLYISRYLIGILTKFLFLKINTNVTSKMRIAMINKSMRLPMDYYNENDKGYILSRISECANVANIFSASTANIFVSIFEFIFAFAAIISLNIKISFLVLALIPLYFLTVSLSSKKFTKNISNTMDNNAILSGEVFETLNNIEEIKILNIYQVQMKQMSKQ